MEPLYKNVKRPDGTVDCILVELGMFGSCESSLNSESDISGGSYNDFYLSSIFLGNRTIMAIYDYEPKDVKKLDMSTPLTII